MRISALLAAGLAALGLSLAATPAAGAQEGPGLIEPANGWTFEGYFGKYDKNQLQRGYKVYREVCSACHSMKFVTFGDLARPGGPFYDAETPNPTDNKYVKAIASDVQVGDIDADTGDAIKRAARTSDHFPPPFPNEAAARAGNGGALPPDLSVIVSAREGGASYVYSILNGFVAPPQGLTVNAGQYYNRYFGGDTTSQWAGDPRQKPAGGFLAMKPPLPQDGLVTFDDGTPSTVPQMAQDVATFLSWVSEPKMQTRKEMGLAVLAYLAIFAAVVYASYRRIWRNVEH